MFAHLFFDVELAGFSHCPPDINYTQNLSSDFHFGLFQVEQGFEDTYTAT